MSRQHESDEDVDDEDFVVSEREEGTSSDSESDTSAHGLAKKRSPLLRSKNDADESVLSDSEIEQMVAEDAAAETGEDLDADPAPDAVAGRTRARAPLVSVDLEDLEAMLMATDEDLAFLDPIGDSEYQTFLQSLRAPELVPQGAEAEEEDQDFDPGFPVPSLPILDRAMRSALPRPWRHSLGVFAWAPSGCWELQPLSAAAPPPPSPGPGGLPPIRPRVPAGRPGRDALVEPGAFQPAQYRELHQLLHSHVQLLTQLAALTHGAPAPDTEGIADAARKLLAELGDCVSRSGAARKDEGLPPYDAHALGMEWRDSSSNAPGWQVRMRNPTHAIGEVAILADVPAFLEAIAAAPPPQRQASPAEASAGENTDWKRKRRKLDRHSGWSLLSDQASDAAIWMERRGHVDLELAPKPPEHVTTSQRIFSPAEDKLLALGILRFGYDWERIQQELLPVKLQGQLFIRKKNRTAGGAPDNVLKRAVSSITGPLSEEEQELLSQIMPGMGLAPRRWEAVCRDYLPHREPRVLSLLWSQVTEGASLARPDKARRRRDRAAARRGPVRTVFLDPADFGGSAALAAIGSRPADPGAGGPAALASVLLPVGEEGPPPSGGAASRRLSILRGESTGSESEASESEFDMPSSSCASEEEPEEARARLSPPLGAPSASMGLLRDGLDAAQGLVFEREELADSDEEEQGRGLENSEPAWPPPLLPPRPAAFERSAPGSRPLVPLEAARVGLESRPLAAPGAANVAPAAPPPPASATASAGAGRWRPDQDREMLRAALEARGKLDAAGLLALAGRVGAGADAVRDRCVQLLDRFLARVRCRA